MRLSFVAAFAAGSSALLHKKHRTAAPSVDLDAQKAKLEAEEKNFQQQKADLDKKLKSVGLYDMLHGSSAEGESSKIQKQYKEMRESATKKAHAMSHDEALDQLKDKISADERKQLALLMEKGKSKAAEDDKAMYVKAVTTLNDMFLSVEDERTNLITHCHNDLFEMYRRLFLTWTTLYNIFAMSGEAWSEGWKAFWGKWSAIQEKLKEQEKLRQIKTKQAASMAVLDEELVKREADAALYRFIIGAIEPKCNDGGMKFMQTDAKVEQKKMKCQEKCAAQGKHVMNKAVLQVFADPKVMDKAKWALNEHAQMSMKTMLEHIHTAESEEVHRKYAANFLQVSSKKQPHEPWRIDERDGCGCGSLEEMSCDVMLTLIGQELECAKSLVREQEGIINKQKEGDKAEIEEQNDVIAGLEKHIENQDTLIVNAISELKNYRPAFWQNVWKLMALWHEIHVRKFKCIMRLDELEQNQFCALKHIRQYMSDLALEAFDANRDQLQDCEVDDELAPTGDCMLGPQIMPCLPGEYLPGNPDMLPKQEWTRSVLVAPDQDPKLVEAMGNVTISLQCPATMSMTLKCNVFLCPRDCAVSDWSDFSSCTADCDGGYQQRTRQITTVPRNGGAKCPETSESQECNTHPCDVNCVLHEDYVEDKGCLQACTPSGAGRLEMLKKHVKEEAKGKGECPDKHHESRIMESPCKDRQCQYDEVCADVMDLVIAYECSVATSRLGCWFMASFVVALLQKMPASAFGFPTMEVALVKFGNGMSVKMPNTKDQYYVKEAHTLATLTGAVESLPELLYADVIGMWTGQTKWHLGFNNIGQAFKLAQKILDESDRTEGDVVADKKLLVLTKGKRSGCTVVKSVSEEMKEKDIVIDLVLFSETYAENPVEFEPLEEAVTYPHRYHLHNPGAASRLNDWGFRYQTAQALIPSLCPDAISPYFTLKNLCEKRVQLLHRGRTCHDWTHKLADEPVTLEECRNRAFEKGFKSFIHTDVSGDPEATEPNCFTHPENGKIEPTDEMKQALENSCTYVPDYGKEEPDKHKGWAQQEVAAGNGQVTSHYKVVESGADCPGAWGSYMKYAFQQSWQPKKFFVGHKSDTAAGDL